MKKETIIAGLMLTSIVFIPIVQADTVGYTTLNQLINSGSLTISGPATVTLSESNVAAAEQIVTGTISSINVNDFRGTGAGWSASLSMENLTLTKTPQAELNNTSPLISLDSNSRYDGSCGAEGGFYLVTIAASGSVGTATYTVTGGCNETLQTNSTTALSNNPIGSKGVKINFPEGTYFSGDKWHVFYDAYPYTDMKITPQDAVAAINGSDIAGLTSTNTSNFIGTGITSLSKTILSASNNKGLGSYNQDILLELTVHPRSLQGFYSGSITLNIS